MNSKVWGGLALFGGCLSAAVWMIPTLFPADGYRQRLETAAERASGRPVSIDGPMEWHLLPWPQATVRSVRMANIEGGSTADMVRVPEIAVDLSFWALLRGRVEVTHVELRDPWVSLERSDSGQANWVLSPSRRAAAPSQSDAALVAEALSPLAEMLATRSATDTEPPPVQIDLHNGSLTYRSDVHATTPDHSLSIPHASLSGSTSGPLRLDAQILYRRGLFSLQGVLGERQSGKPVAASLRLALLQSDSQASDAAVSLSAQLAPSLSLADGWKADLKADGTSLAAVVRACTTQGERPLTGGLSLRASLSGSAQGVAVEDLLLDLGDSHGQGRLSVQFPTAEQTKTQFSSQLTFGNVDLDHWRSQTAAPVTADAAPLPAAPTLRSDGSLAEEGLETAALPVAPAMVSLSLPADWSGTTDVRLGALTWNGGVVRQGHLALRLDDGRVTVEELTALAPGGATVAASGTVTAAPIDAGGLAFDLSVQAQSDNARALLDWLTRSPTGTTGATGGGIESLGIPTGRLSRLQATATVGGTLRELQLRDIETTLDSTKARAAAIVRPPLIPGQRWQVGASLALDSLNLDAYWPKESPSASSPAPASAPASASGAPPAASGGPTTRALDANVKLSIENLIWNAVPLRGLSVDASMVGDTLTLRPSSVTTTGGGSITVSGSLEALSSAAPRLSDGHYRLSASDAGRLARALSWSLPVSSAALGEVVAEGRLSGTLPVAGAGADLDLSTASQWAGGSVAVQGRVRGGLSSALSFEGEVSGQAPDAARVVRLWQSDYQPAAALGAGSLRANVALAAGRLSVSNGELSVGRDHVTGSGAVQWAAARPRFEADVTVQGLHLDRYGLSDHRAAPPESRWSQRHEPPAPSFTDSGERQLAWSLPLPAQGLTAGVISDAPAAGLWQWTASAAHWSSRAFDLESLRAWDGVLKVKGKDMALKGLLFDHADLSATLNQGVFALESLTGSLYGGPMTASGQLDARAVPRLTATVKADGMQLARALDGLTGSASASGSGHLALELTAEGGSPALMIDSLSGQGSFSLDGVRPTAAARGGALALLAPLTALNQLGSMGGADSGAARLSSGFQAQNGVVSLRALTLESAAYQAQMQGIVNLGMWTLDLDGQARLLGSTAAFVAQKLKLPDVVPVAVTGDIDAPRVRVGTGIAARLLGNGGAPSLSEPPPARPQDQILRGLLERFLPK